MKTTFYLTNYWKYVFERPWKQLSYWTFLETNFSKGVLNLPSKTKTQEAFWNNFHWRHVFSRVASETYGFRGTGWWFGTFFFFIYWEFHNPNWRNPSFFRGVGLIHPSTNQGNIVMTPWLWKPSSQSSQRRDIAHWDDWFKEPNKDGVSLWVYGMVTGYFHHIYNRLMGIHGG